MWNWTLDKLIRLFKAFYSFITVENLNLIKNQKEELNNCKSRHEANQKKLLSLKEKNTKLEVSLRESQRGIGKRNELFESCT